MPIYEYRALTGGGKSKKGIIDADTAREARTKLRGDHLHVTEMWESDGGGKKKPKTKSDKPRFEMPRLERKINLKDLSAFTRQFSTLLKSGIQQADAMRALVEQCEDRDFEKILRNIKEEITAGNSLAEAMAKHPKCFSDLYVNMVRAGEASGNLDVVLIRVADYLQKQASLRGKVVSALTYPCIMLFVGVAVVVFLMSFVVPKIAQILLDSGKPLPMITHILMTASEIIKGWYPLIVAGIFGVIFLFRWAISTSAGKLKFHTFLLKMPVFGSLFTRQAVARFSLTLSTLLKSGLPALESLKIVSLVVNNAKLTEVINDIHSRILEGADIATPIRKSSVFPPMVGYMVSVGEQSGELEEILDRIAQSYEEELDLAIQRITALIEPVIIILLAVVVSFIIAAVLIPLLDFQNV
ncbi:MAG: type II secretion system inner membrane protein GspF [Planctomycetota bacterium]